MRSCVKKLVTVLVSLFSIALSDSIHAQVGPELLTAKREAETKGYLFEISHDEIVAKAKQEGGKLRVLSGLDREVFPRMVQLFKQKYPFLDVYIQETSGSDAAQKFILKMKTTGHTDWDAVHVNTDFLAEFPPFMKRFDLFGMAKQRVLDVPVKMIDPQNRNLLAVGTAFQAIAYNKNLLSAEKAPTTWEDFLKPEFKGRKFVVDIRPWGFPCLVPLMGEEWVREYSKKLASQEPVWGRGMARDLTAMTGGEYALHSGANYHSIMRVKGKDPAGSLVERIVEPVPVRLIDPNAVIGTAAHPYSALLWIEHLASREAQKVIDEHEPGKASFYLPGSITESLLRGKKLSIVEWNSFLKMADWMKMIVSAWGFPRAEK
jgi:ABC-type thiamine transport system substrate-binding protein